MNAGEITSLELVNLYGSRIQDQAVEFGLPTEENFKEALQLAEQCDQ